MAHLVQVLSARSCAVALVAIFWVLPSYGADRPRIEIESSWFGYLGQSKSTLVITGHDQKYSAHGHRVSAQAVERLLAALHEPPVERLSMESCGIDSHWLSANTEPALSDFLHRKPTPKLIALFRSKFTDVTVLQQVLENIYASSHSDDYPEMRVSVLRNGEKEFVLHSESQHPFMLPWMVEGGSQPANFNCRINQAIAALLPAKFTNRDRLAISNSIRWELTEGVMQIIRDGWYRVDAEEKLGPDLVAIHARFSLTKSEITCEDSVDVGKAWVPKGEPCLSWNAELQEKGQPPNMNLGVSLPYRDGRLVGAGQFLAQIKDYEAMVLSVPWLTEFMKRDPTTVVELRYVNDRSLSRRAQADLVREMKGCGEIELADRLVREGDKSAFLIIHGPADTRSMWVVFPNREMLLWRFKGASVLHWQAPPFITCGYNGWPSAGGVIEPDGTFSR